MNRLLPICLSVAVAACSPSPKPAPQPSAAATLSPLAMLSPAPAALGDLMKSRTWRSEDGKLLSDWFGAEARRLMQPMTREQTIDQFEKAGWSCIYGEGSEGYPNPLQVCSLSFGTPECQLDWEISTQADNKGETTEVDTTFTRDCVGVDRDWPDKKTGEMDKNLAPGLQPATPSPTPPH